jgi:hypothetical protein
MSGESFLEEESFEPIEEGSLPLEPIYECEGEMSGYKLLKKYRAGERDFSGLDLK